MAKVFISHSTKDYNFVSLLEALLKFHYIDVWCSPSDIRPGTQFQLDIERALREANTLLVIASKNAVKSKWITKEITAFQTQNYNAPVVPLILESTNLDLINPGLSSYQSIDFSQSMLEGYKSIFGLLGKEFLSYRERRNDMTRRHSTDRRGPGRRKSTLIQRMRLGFWTAYSKTTGKGEFDELLDTTREKLKVIDSLREATLKFQYIDDMGDPYPPEKVLDIATQRVWTLMKNRAHFRAIYLIEAIAEEIYEQYKIEETSDRRHQDRRLVEGRRKNRGAN